MVNDSSVHAPRAFLAALWTVGCAALVACGADSGHHPLTTSIGDGAGTPNAVLATASTQGVSFVSDGVADNCLVPQDSRGAVLGVKVGVAPCRGLVAERWRMADNGQLVQQGGLVLGQDGNGGNLALVNAASSDSLSFTLVGGHVVLSSSVGQALVSALQPVAAAPDSNSFIAVQLGHRMPSDRDAQALWSVGLASPLNGNHVLIEGFSLRLAASPAMCLAGQGSQIGVSACTSAVSQAFTINNAGCLQLGNYCVAADTQGAVAQGTTLTFAQCATGAARQAWSIGQGVLMLGGLWASPTAVPPPPNSFTPASLVASQVGWHIGL